MPKTAKTVDEYIALQPADVQRALKRVRSTIRKAVPHGEDVISYKIPAYKLRGRIVVLYGGQHDKDQPHVDSIFDRAKPTDSHPWACRRTASLYLACRSRSRRR